MRKNSAQSMQLKDEMAKEIGVYETVRQNGAEGMKYPDSEKENRASKTKQPKDAKS